MFLLETKNYSGRLSIRHGAVFTEHDGDERPRKARSLGRWMRKRSAQLSEDIAETLGHRPWIHPVVVLWGDFPDRIVEHERVAYVHGEELAEWLRSRPPVREPIEIVRP